MTEWQKLQHEWLYAIIGDDAFIRAADEMGKGPQARKMVKADLETP